MIRLALRSALSDRAADGKVVVIGDWGWTAPSTKAGKAAMGALGLDGRVLVVVQSDEDNVILSFRNLPEVQLVEIGELNAYDVLCNDWIVFSTASLPGSGSSRDTGPKVPPGKVPPVKPSKTPAAAAADDDPDADEPEAAK